MKNLIEQYVQCDFIFVNIYMNYFPQKKIGRIFTKMERTVIAENHSYKLFLFYFLTSLYPFNVERIFLKQTVRLATDIKLGTSTIPNQLAGNIP